MSHTKAKKKKKAKIARKSRGLLWRTVRNSDPHELYELSVQEPEAECDLIDQVWKEQRGRKAYHIREDFCGTAAVCAAWVKRRRSNTAVGVDLDSNVLAWGTTKHLDELKPNQRSRVKLIEGDVCSTRTKRVDSVLAMNFSYWIFKERKKLVSYFKTVRGELKRDGLFLLDAYGGSDSHLEMTEDRNFNGFVYVWDQNKCNPITGDILNHIHFEFPDGSKMKRAFTYDWRFWSLPELRDVLLDAGFRDVVVYWEGTTRKGEGNGIWKVTTRGEAIEGWLAYIVAKK